MRKLILIVLLTCSMAWMLPQISIAEVDPETAVGVWLFDEGAGNETKDASGNDHDGTINGAKWKDGKFGKALEFDGGQWVSIESTPELQVGEELTMMAWFFATDIGDWRQLIAKSDEYLLRIDPPQEGNRMSSFVKPGGSWEPRASANVPDEDTWIHFAATYDSNAKNEHLVVYVNGERAGVSTRPGDIAVTANAVEIGRWGGGSYFVGIIDEAAIFNTVLSEDDLKAIADNGLAKVLGGLAVAPTNKLATTWATLKADR
ncbi:MAG: LamG domain-containing protein [Candidatus Poribacteria bacterium]|nr:LamG domain-containing protein [Candidatus Poribacteria bacterium]